jgi:hypothetical protein
LRQVPEGDGRKDFDVLLENMRPVLEESRRKSLIKNQAIKIAISIIIIANDERKRGANQPYLA